jgi:hypothetical protein
VIKLMRAGRAGHVIRMVVEKLLLNLSRKPGRKGNHLGNNIKMDIKEIGHGLDQLAQDKSRGGLL